SAVWQLHLNRLVPWQVNPGAIGERRQNGTDREVLPEPPTNGPRAVDVGFGSFAQLPEATGGVDLGVGQDTAGDWCSARRTCRGPEIAAGGQLRADIGRNIQQEPGTVIGGHGDGRLRPRSDSAGSLPCGFAIRAAAVPLRHAAAGCRTEDA